jgi:DNA-binding CsgD family transcriptional regulator
MKWHPFAEKFPLLEGEEREALKESIRSTKGIDAQPILYRMKGAVMEGLDGRNRYEICRELRIKPKMKRVHVKDEDVAEFILRLNVHRRHMTREQRQQIVAELRSQGKTTRQIAEALNVNQGTVVRDLGSVDARASTETVVGSDGKTYQATKPKLACRDHRVNGAGYQPDCPNCELTNTPATREPGDDTEQIEADKKTAAAVKKKQGQALLNWKRWADAFGVLARFHDDLYRQAGLLGPRGAIARDPAYDALDRVLGEYRKSVRKRYQELFKQKPPNESGVS